MSTAKINLPYVPSLYLIKMQMVNLFSGNYIYKMDNAHKNSLDKKEIYVHTTNISKFLGQHKSNIKPVVDDDKITLNKKINVIDYPLLTLNFTSIEPDHARDMGFMNKRVSKTVESTDKIYYDYLPKPVNVDFDLTFYCTEEASLFQWIEQLFKYYFNKESILTLPDGDKNVEHSIYFPVEMLGQDFTRVDPDTGIGRFEFTSQLRVKGFLYYQTIIAENQINDIIIQYFEHVSTGSVVEDGIEKLLLTQEI